MSDVFRDLYNELIEMDGAIYIRFVSCPSCGTYYMWLALADSDNNGGIEGFIEVARGVARFPSYVLILDEEENETVRVRKVWPIASPEAEEQILTVAQWVAVESALLEHHVCRKRKRRWSDRRLRTWGDEHDYRTR